MHFVSIHSLRRDLSCYTLLCSLNCATREATFTIGGVLCCVSGGGEDTDDRGSLVDCSWFSKSVCAITSRSHWAPQHLIVVHRDLDIATKSETTVAPTDITIILTSVLVQLFAISCCVLCLSHLSHLFRFSIHDECNTINHLARTLKLQTTWAIQKGVCKHTHLIPIDSKNKLNWKIQMGCSFVSALLIGFVV